MVFAAIAGNTSNLYARCTAGNCINGKGTFLYPNGSRYEGEFKEGSFHGEGIYYFFNGSQYQGTWKEGKMSGQGTWRYANGMKMKGSFTDGKISGDAKPEPVIIYNDFNYISSIVPENTEMLLVMKSVEDIFIQLPVTEKSFFGEKIKNVNRLQNELGFNPFSKKDLEKLGVDMKRQVGVVVSDLDLKDVNQPSMNVVIALPVTKDGNFLATLRSTFRRISRNRGRFEYHGDVLRFLPGRTTKNFKKTFGVVKRNGYLFLGFNPNGDVAPYLQKIIDRKKTLAESTVYRDVVGKIDTGEEAFVYLDGRKFADIYTMILAQSGKNRGMNNQQRMAMGMASGMMKNMISIMKDYRGIGMTLDYNRGDLVLKGISVLKEGSELLKMYQGITYDRKNVLGVSKRPVALAVIGVNMKEYINFMMKSLPPFLSMTVQGKMQKLKDSDGIDVQVELIDNLAGNINVGVYDGGTFSSENLNVVMTANVKDVKVMQGFIKKVFADAPKDKVKPLRIGRVQGRVISMKKQKIFFGMAGKNIVVALSESMFRASMRPRMSRTFLYKVDPEVAKVINKDGTTIYVDAEELLKAVKSFSRVSAKKQKGKQNADKNAVFEKVMKHFYYLCWNSWNRDNVFFTKAVLKTKFNKPFFRGVTDLIQEINILEKKNRQKPAVIIEKK